MTHGSSPRRPSSMSVEIAITDTDSNLLLRPYGSKTVSNLHRRLLERMLKSASVRDAATGREAGDPWAQTFVLRGEAANALFPGPERPNRRLLPDDQPDGLKPSARRAVFDRLGHRAWVRWRPEV